MLNVVYQFFLAVVLELRLLVVVIHVEVHDLGLTKGLAMDGCASVIDVLGCACACVEGTVVLVVEALGGAERCGW